MLRTTVFALVIFAAAVSAAFARAAGKFDYYVLSLSWSPTHCAEGDNARRDPRQCGVRRGFVLHGLWPQYERGYPDFCPTTQPRNVPAALKREFSDLMTSSGLIEYQWDKHGVCSGLSQRAYLSRARSLRGGVAIPPAFTAPAKPIFTTPAALRGALLNANPALRANGMALRCQAGQLEEVRLCFTKTGAPRACGTDVKDNCPSKGITLPAM
jgi:ribonuclease T2